MQFNGQREGKVATDGMTTTPCPICANPNAEAGGSNLNDNRFFKCPQCGDFGLTYEAVTDLRYYLENWDNAAKILAYFIRRIPVAPPHGVPVLTTGEVRRIIENEVLPTPAVQANNLLLWIGNNAAGPGELIDINSEELPAVVGAKSGRGVQYILEGLEQKDLVKGSIWELMGDNVGGEVTPSFEGWERIEEPQRGAASGRMAFMAMEYDDEALDKYVQDHFAPAVAETGFHLQRLDDVPKAGLIDDRLRVEIQSCRFLVADLSHANNGAYWEAG